MHLYDILEILYANKKALMTNIKYKWHVAYIAHKSTI